jgi:cytoskeletal protein RodZ
MTRTDDVASNRSRKQGTTRLRAGLRRAWQTLAVVPVVLVLGALLTPASALAAESTSGYSQTAPTPKTSTTPTPAPAPAPAPTSSTTPTPAPAPTSGTSPSKETEKSTPEATAPAKETAPTTSTSPSTSTSKAATLPFTGLDLRWSVAIGVLLIGLGFSILAVQRRERGRSG